MSEKWVTLAIRTYQRAQKIKAVLEQYEIETVIHNLNLENPETAVGVRVRIKECDLPRALGIVEEMEKTWEVEAVKENPMRGKTILIPVELSDQINTICKYGFYFAKKMEAKITFFHAYLTPSYTITSASNTEINTYSLTDSETLRRIIHTNKADVQNLTNLIRKWIDSGEIPQVDFRFEIKEGVPEEEILAYCKREKPALVVMGTHSRRHGKESNVIGSVTAEVLEASRVPVLAVSAELEQVPENIRRIAFLTNFDQKDLIAIDKAISLLKKESLEITFIHATDKQDGWNEVMLAGIKTYFANHYPEVKTDYAFLKKEDEPTRLQSFLATSKIDLVALNTPRRSLFARFFNQGLATKLLFNIDTPLLVMRV